MDVTGLYWYGFVVRLGIGDVVMGVLGVMRVVWGLRWSCDAFTEFTGVPGFAMLVVQDGDTVCVNGQGTVSLHMPVRQYRYKKFVRCSLLGG